jgi:hypothetical protein
MNHGYVERWRDLALTVDKVGEDTEGNHLVEVTVHDRPVMDEMSVRMTVSKEYYGSMIPWLAARVVISDLATTSYERSRLVKAGRMQPDIHIENKAEYLEAFESVPGLCEKALKLPEEALRAHMIFVLERKSTSDPDVSAAASIHNAHKAIFDRGIPDVLEFLVDAYGERVVEARWNPKVVFPYEERFLGFDWKTVPGQYALEDFLGMLNLRVPLEFKDITPRRIPRRQGPKEWSPDEYQSFMLIKGRDYGRPA